MGRGGHALKTNLAYLTIRINTCIVDVLKYEEICIKMKSMPIQKAATAKVDEGPKERPLSFRFSKGALEKLNALAVYGNLTLIDVVETLIGDEFDRLKSKDQKGIEMARAQGIKSMAKRKRS